MTWSIASAHAGVPTRVVLVTDGSVSDTPPDVHRVTVGRVAEDLLRL